MKDILPDEPRVIVRQCLYDFGIELTIAVKTGDGRILSAKPIVMEELQRGTALTPAMVMDDSMAIQLMNALWQAGVRPSRQLTSSGQLEAMREHISDLRRVAFAKSRKSEHSDQ